MPRFDHAEREPFSTLNPLDTQPHEQKADKCPNAPDAASAHAPPPLSNVPLTTSSQKTGDTCRSPPEEGADHADQPTEAPRLPYLSLSLPSTMRAVAAGRSQPSLSSDDRLKRSSSSPHADHLSKANPNVHVDDAQAHGGLDDDDPEHIRDLARMLLLQQPGTAFASGDASVPTTPWVGGAGTPWLPTRTFASGISPGDTPLLRTFTTVGSPALRFDHPGSSLMGDWDAFDVPADDRARSGKRKPDNAPIGVRHIVRQSTDRNWKPCFEQRIVRAACNDVVCFHWYNPQGRIFETDHSYQFPVSYGRHSTMTTTHTTKDEADDAGSTADRDPGMFSLPRGITGPDDSSSEAAAADEARAGVNGGDVAVTNIRRSHCVFEVHFTEPGTYYFICTTNPYSMRVRVFVEDRHTNNARHIVTGLLLILLCIFVVVTVVLVLAFWLRSKDLFLSREDANSAGEYEAIHRLQNVITLYLFPWVAFGVMCFVVVVLISVGLAIYHCSRPRDPRRESQSRGFPKIYLTVTTWLCVALCVIIAVLLFVAYGLQLDTTDGLNLFAEQLGTSLQYTVGNFSRTLDQVDWLVQESETLFPDVEIPRETIESVTANVMTILNKSSEWVVLGQDAIQGAFRLLPILLFLTLQIGLYVSAMSIGDVALRCRKTAVAVLWLVACCVAVMSCACGVVWAESKFLGLIYDSAVVVGTTPGKATTQFGIAPDSFIAELFSYCYVSPTNASDLTQYAKDVVADINSSLTCEEQAAFTSIAETVEQAVPFVIEALLNFSDYVEANLASANYILSHDAEGVNAFFKKNITEFLTVGVDIVSTGYSLVNCRILTELIGNSIPILRRNVEQNNDALFVVLLITFGFTIIQLVCTGLFVFFLVHPRKRWFEARSGRWFRFRYSYVVHRRLLLAEHATEEASEQATGWRLAWRRLTSPVMYKLLNTRLVMYASSTLMFFDCVLLVLFNNMARSIVATPLISAISYLGCVQLILIIAATLFRQHWIQVGLPICALLVVAVVLVLSLVQLLLGYIHFGRCLREARYKQLITNLAHGHSITDVPQYEACPLTYVGHELEVAVYASVMFLNCISLMVCLILVLVHHRYLAPLFSRRPYTGVLVPLATCSTFFSRLFRDRLNVHRVYSGILIFALIVCLVLFAALNNSDTFQLVHTEHTLPSGEDILQTLDPTVACNGDPRYCSLRVNQLIWACTHNAHSNMEDHFLTGNHYFNITRQLHSGIRSFMIDLWYDKPNASISDEEDVYLCHSVCVSGRVPFRTVAATYAEFLDRYPGQVVMLILQQMVNDTDIVRIMDEVGLTKYVWYSDQEAPNLNPDYVWPTLQEMIDKGQRLMMFNDAKGNSPMSVNRPEWMYYGYNFQYENDYQTDNISQWRCGVGRGWCSRDEDLYREDNWWRKETNTSTVNCPVDPNEPTTTTTTTTVGPTTTTTFSPEQKINALHDFTNCSGDPGPWVNGSDVYNAVMGRQPPHVGRKLSTMNHMMTMGVGMPMKAVQANVPDSIRYNTYRCAVTWNQVVNILAYDYWSIDYPLEVINAMNQNIATYGPQYDFKDQWKLLLFGDANAVVEPPPGEVPM